MKDQNPFRLIRGGQGCDGQTCGCSGSGGEEKPPPDLGLECGAPMRHPMVRTGDRVLVAGSDMARTVFPIAVRVGPFGRVLGVEEDDALLRRALDGIEPFNYLTGLSNVAFRKGARSALPADDGRTDVVYLQWRQARPPDLPPALKEAHRVLRAGGRLFLGFSGFVDGHCSRRVAMMAEAAGFSRLRSLGEGSPGRSDPGDGGRLTFVALKPKAEGGGHPHEAST